MGLEDLSKSSSSEPPLFCRLPRPGSAVGRLLGGGREGGRRKCFHPQQLPVPALLV
jgi:hypothetical protein